MRTKLTIRSKLAAALALPLIALTVFVGFQLRDEGLFVYLLAAAGAVGLTVFVLFLASTWITNPLREMADDALEVATERLPATVAAVLAAPVTGEEIVLEPVEGRGGAEIVQVANALNALQRAAVELATEQAALRRSINEALVNLGRRTQQLLSRQIELITRLESKEQNPELLEQLFKLDHLATRMRRNAESLLVLAGEEAPRQWTAAQPVGDVVRAALGEVEDFSRVRIHQLDEATIVGHAVADLSHVVAELVENGLQFSPPESVVDLYGRIGAHGYVVSVNDHGIGMSPDDMARANERFVSMNALTVTPSRYLGHYVVGQLTSRHNCTVTLTESPGGGITATMVVSPELVEGMHTPAAVPTFSFGAALDPEPEPDPQPESQAPAALAEVPRLDRRPAPAPEPQPVATAVATAVAAAVASAPAAEPEPETQPDPQPDHMRAPAFLLPPGEPYAELVSDRREREAEEIAGAVEEVKEVSGMPAYLTTTVDDLLPKLPRRRDHGRSNAPATIPALAPRPNGTDAESETPGDGATTAPVSEEVQSNMAVYAAFRAAAERGREDARQ